MPACEKEFPSHASSVAKAREFVRGYLTAWELSAGDISDVLMASGEACSNAILYAASEKPFRVSCQYEGGVLTVKVQDSGRGFVLQGSGLGHKPRALGAGGLGIHIMRVLMDEVSFEMSEQGTTVKLLKRIAKSKKPTEQFQ
ncbi:MAG: ATP-binding protein [Candidatus Eremiobacteraeota bacterium]|nr:ATP-binding protein [Candidatus Eremiobacteraeota bacterium]MBV8204152.1 ATP-binding protein [Candidatus Eremiobacteraeota bacterium]MBV8339649.1 ATP-binding protein [Candidatus Eremiobacteraeota bacterium]MBV8460602.1 ATP-binding protein [Candidatus Eremiobacteraeota bacterium]MBV8594708.1 ATP-binding protein [Candidatus Eremiobacteraeota bacterium]